MKLKANYFHQLLQIDRLFNGLTRTLTVSLLLLMVAMLLSLLFSSLPSIFAFGIGFFVSDVWNPVTDQFGALAPIAGTLLTAFIALCIAIPISGGIAVFIAEIAPFWLKRPLVITIELMAGIPSIVYGMWGLFVLVPIMGNVIQPHIAMWLSPLFPHLADGPFIGINLMTAGLLLAIMVIPFIAAMLYDLIEHLPKHLIESAYSAGANRTEVFFKIVLPAIRTGAMGSIILGFGRALGETMAVTFVIGNVHRFSFHLFEPSNTIASVIANEFAEATGKLYPAALLNLGLVLFLITVIVLICARLLLNRYKA